MANTRFFLDKRNAKEGKPVVLKIAIAHQHKSALISLDAKILPSQWDEDSKQIVRHPEKLVLNTYINRLKSQVDSLIVRWTNDGLINSMSASEIKERCLEELDPDKKKAKEDQTLFLYRFNRYAERLRPGSKRTFDHTLNRLTAFKGENYLRKMKFEDMTVDWLKEFDAFMAKTAPSVERKPTHLCSRSSPPIMPATPGRQSRQVLIFLSKQSQPDSATNTATALRQSISTTTTAKLILQTVKS